MTRFFTGGNASDPAYVMWRDEALYAHGRERVEKLWTRYEPYCPDRQFLAEARSHFLERTWEMHLACVLMDCGFALRKTASTGPDICIDCNPPMWVEAIAVGGGQTDDRVRDREERRYTEYVSDPNVWHGKPPSEESLILRCTHALETKREAYAKYRAKGIVKDTDICIIGISFAGIDDAFYLFNYDEIPIVIKAFFGIGPDMLSISRDGNAKTRWFNPHRARVTKRSGAEVVTNAFAAGHSDDISGVFATPADLANSPDSGEKIMFVNNPSAHNLVSVGTFPFGTEFIASDGNVGRKHWSRLTSR